MAEAVRPASRRTGRPQWRRCREILDLEVVQKRNGGDGTSEFPAVWMVMRGVADLTEICRARSGSMRHVAGVAFAAESSPRSGRSEMPLACHFAGCRGLHNESS